MTTKPPPGLASRGREFWTTTTGKFELSEQELSLLIEACRTMDDLDHLAAAIKRDGVMTTGSTGQSVVNPALTEARGQRLALHRILAALALPDEDGAAVKPARSIRAETAAKARWAGHRKDVGA